jgi:hypothetical protein
LTIIQYMEKSKDPRDSHMDPPGFFPRLSTGTVDPVSRIRPNIRAMCGASCHMYGVFCFIHTIHSPYYYYESESLFNKCLNLIL